MSYISDVCNCGAEESRTPVLDGSREGFAAESKPSGP